MANTYTQIHIQVVFTVQNRESIIYDKWKDELYKYICGIIQNNHHKLLSINGMPDHIHILFGLQPYLLPQGAGHKTLLATCSGRSYKSEKRREIAF